MWTMLKNAWAGWHEMSEAGKLIGLLMVMFLVLILYSLIIYKRKKLRSVISDIGGFFCPNVSWKGAIIAVYAVVMLVLCIFPFTAIFLMLYQTRFYDYYWVFSYIPVTLVLSLGIAAVILMIWDKDRSKRGIWKAGAATLMLLFIIFLCGAGSGQGQDSAPLSDYTKMVRLLEEIQEIKTDDILLWGPESIMASARRVSPAVKLLYGRNVWEKALDAYSFDGSEEWQEELFGWMKKKNEGASWEEEDEGYIKMAIRHGVNVIIFSKDSWEETRNAVSEITGVTYIQMADYYVFLLHNGQ